VVLGLQTRADASEGVLSLPSELGFT